MPNFRHKPNAGWAVRIIRREFHMCLEQKERTVARDARVKERWCIRTGRSIIVYANYQRRPSFRKLFTSHLRIARRVWKKLDDSGRRWREERWRGARSREGWICPEKQPRNGAFTKFDPIVQTIELIYSPRESFSSRRQKSVTKDVSNE